MTRADSMVYFRYGQGNMDTNGFSVHMPIVGKGDSKMTRQQSEQHKSNQKPTVHYCQQCKMPMEYSKVTKKYVCFNCVY